MDAGLREPSGDERGRAPSEWGTHSGEELLVGVTFPDLCGFS